MLSDEEKKEYEELKSLLYTGTISQYGKRKLIDIIEKQSKEIEELKEKNEPQPDCTEPVERAEEMVNMTWVNYHYISKEEYENAIKTTFKVCNKHWKDKIKAKIEEVEQWELYNMKIPRLSTLHERLGAKIGIKYVLQSLLEKEQ